MKKKDKATTTALIPVISRALPTPQVIPKLSKSQIIKAMVEQARRKHEKAIEEYSQREEEILEKIKVAADSEIRKAIDVAVFEMSKVSSGGWGKDESAPKTVKLEVEVSSPEIRTLLKEWFKNEATSPGSFWEQKHEEKIKAAMDNTEDKINLILAQPENVETIDALLAKIFVKKED